MIIAVNDGRFVNGHKKRRLKVVLILWELTDWLLRSLCSLRLTPFRPARRGGPYKNCTTQEVDKSTLLFLVLRPTNKFACVVPKTKKMSFDIFLLRLFLWELTDSNRRPSACKADALNQLS